MNGKQQARAFRIQYNLSVINSATLCQTLNAQGYTIIEFNGIREKESVADLISALHLEDQIAHSKCFTYQSDKYRLIFIHEDLNDNERTVVLAHEEGHIWNQHMHKDNAIGTGVHPLLITIILDNSPEGLTHGKQYLISVHTTDDTALTNGGTRLGRRAAQLTFTQTEEVAKVVFLLDANFARLLNVQECNFLRIDTT